MKQRIIMRLPDALTIDLNLLTVLEALLVERHVTRAARRVHMSQPAVSHHLALLRHGSIIAPRRQGKNNFYGLTESGEELAKVVKALIT